MGSFVFQACGARHSRDRGYRHPAADENHPGEGIDVGQDRHR